MLKFTYEKETDIPEAQKALYEHREIELATGNKVKLWVLGVEDVVPKARFVEFRDNNKELLAKNKELAEKLEGIDDPSKAKALLRIAKDVELDDAEKVLKKGGVDAIIAERVKGVKDDYERKLAESNARAVEAKTALDRFKIDNAIITAANKLSLQPGAEAFIADMGRGIFKVVGGEIVAVDGSGREIYSPNDATAKLSVAEWVEGLPKKFSYLFKESQGADGGGSARGNSGSNGGVNPYAKDHFNMTEQARLARENPALAERLAKQAGARYIPVASR